MDFLDRTIDYIENNVVLSNQFEVGRLSSDPESISIRPTPGSIVNRYIDEGKVRDYTFQILLKGTNQFKVIQKLEEISSLLDGLKGKDIVSSDGSFKLISLKTYVPTNYVEETEREYIYTAMFTAELQGGI